MKISTNILRVFFICSMLCPLSALGQINMDSIKIQLLQRTKVGALVHLPDDYERSGKKNYPLIICFHGKSKSGNDLRKLLIEGIPYWISHGSKIQAASPEDGKTYKFIVVAPQSPSWGFRPSEVITLLNDLEKRYRVDRSRIYLTGYSAGGWSVVSAITESAAISGRIAAAVPMSVAAIDKKNLRQFANVARASTHCWYIAGSSEGRFMEDTRAYADSTNIYAPGLAKMTVIEGFTHHSWRTLYDPRTKPDGVHTIYEWMLQYHRVDRYQGKVKDQ
ncbi:hypothetical protein ACFOTA_18545 [Chitinophaga sp. GCM10012297]|uniref:Prolyl oligopeptidase family protein n=1 Tax=Chitinophaga chungangae TaxID=2821488 RepID=A0ABS3YHR0_9BACT|nr:hypothetical protein [Chitinophaga chungangae]MBO9154221.1 hypothetical protein [Chitinophaga chungangae]